jgi:hypothetical protein
MPSLNVRLSAMTSLCSWGEEQDSWVLVPGVANALCIHICPVCDLGSFALLPDQLLFLAVFFFADRMVRVRVFAIDLGQENLISNVSWPPGCLLDLPLSLCLYQRGKVREK